MAAGDAGEEFIHKLHKITQANIAASRTSTGNTKLGGDWNLELKIGNVEAAIPFQTNVINNYASILAWEPVQVADINLGLPDSNPSRFTVFNNKLYFTADDGVNGEELWSYDDTSQAQIVKDIYVGDRGSKPYGFYVFNNKLYFNANDGIYGTELWSYDGSNDPQLFIDLDPRDNYYSHSRYNSFTAFNNKLYFKYGWDLWSYNGSDEPVIDSKGGVSGITVFNDTLILGGSSYDGTNPRQVIPLNISDSEYYEMSAGGVVFNDKYYFTISTETQGSNLWSYDGVNPATMVQDIAPNHSDMYSHQVYGLTVVNGKLYFSADDGVNGRELWSYDDINSAKMVQDIAPNPVDSFE